VVQNPWSPPAVASRLLARLLRDHRIGGRHTRVEHAWGHHFSDEERPLARDLVERFQREGLLLSKVSEGAAHVSINPRKLREVGAILSAGVA
jgi:hypothetical protein